MRAFMTVLALVWTLLLGAITLQLRTLNQHLSWVSGPIRGLAAIGAQPTKVETPEEREHRIERKAREQIEAVDEQAEIMRRVLNHDPRGKAATGRTSRRSSPGDTPLQR